jgi:nitroimidazol reductase NimA-like FMN-containing flavoprotein (pyridoxamine 5'-phosphate oxidase superfamily)
MILRNREITKFPEMEAIINEAEVCTVAMVNGNKPYVLPFNFAYQDSVVYLHCDTKGFKLDLLRNNPSVCINFNTGNELFYRHKQVGCSWGMKYKSINASGQVEFLENYDEKYRVMKLFMLKYAGEDYEFSEPSIKNVVIMKIAVSEFTGKKYGY